MISEASIMYRLIKALNEQMVPLINLVEIKSAAEHQNVIQQIDTAFACRETIELLDTIKKKVADLQRRSEANASTIMTLIKEEPVKTIYCSAKKKPRIWYKFPYKRSGHEEEFDGLMTYFGIPKNVSENEIVRFHGPGFSDYCTKLAGECKELPTEPTSVELGITMRRLKGVDE